MYLGYTGNYIIPVSYTHLAQVAPNASENISVDITAPSNVKAGTYKIPVIATTGSTSAQLEFEVVITGSYRIELTTPPVSYTHLEIDTIAYPFALKQKIEFFLPKFEVAITNSKLAKEKQFDNSQKFSEYTKKARLYISHFIQVLNFCIARGELKPSARTFYGLDENSSKVPSLLTEQDLLQWGEKIIAGEQNRISNGGGNPIYCPSIALVKVN